MKRVLPFPILSGFLLVLWLLLQQSVGLGHLLLGGLIAIGAGQTMAALAPQPAKVSSPWAITRLLAHVLADVGRSNLAVALLILQGRRRQQTSGFLRLPLALQDRYGLAVLSIIVTATPGSAWLEYDARESTVLIHVFDLVDEAQWIDTIKSRYETLLLEIFH